MPLISARWPLRSFDCMDLGAIFNGAHYFSLILNLLLFFGLATNIPIEFYEID